MATDKGAMSRWCMVSSHPRADRDDARRPADTLYPPRPNASSFPLPNPLSRASASISTPSYSHVAPSRPPRSAPWPNLPRSLPSTNLLRHLGEPHVYADRDCACRPTKRVAFPFGNEATHLKFVAKQQTNLEKPNNGSLPKILKKHQFTAAAC